MLLSFFDSSAVLTMNFLNDMLTTESLTKRLAVMFEAVKKHAARLVSFLKINYIGFVSGLTDKYYVLRYGDVYHNWDQLMRLVRVTDSDEADPTTRKKKIVVIALIMLWMVFSLFRISLFPF